MDGKHAAPNFSYSQVEINRMNVPAINTGEYGDKDPEDEKAGLFASCLLQKAV